MSKPVFIRTYESKNTVKNKWKTNVPIDEVLKYTRTRPSSMSHKTALKHFYFAINDSRVPWSKIQIEESRWHLENQENFASPFSYLIIVRFTLKHDPIFSIKNEVTIRFTTMWIIDMN